MLEGQIPAKDSSGWCGAAASIGPFSDLSFGEGPGSLGPTLINLNVGEYALPSLIGLKLVTPKITTWTWCNRRPCNDSAEKCREDHPV